MLLTSSSLDKIIIAGNKTNDNELSIKDILLQFPSISKNIKNRDFDFSYDYKDKYLLKKDLYLNSCVNFINSLYHSGIKCKQTSVAYKFHSFPIIKIYSYIIDGIREYKTTPSFVSTLKGKITYYLNFFIINNQLHYGFRYIDYTHTVPTIGYLYGEKADNVLKEVSQEKNYDYLALIKNYKIPAILLHQLKQQKICIFAITSFDDHMNFETNIDLKKYHFYEYMSQSTVNEELINFSK